MKRPKPNLEEEFGVAYIDRESAADLAFWTPAYFYLRFIKDNYPDDKEIKEMIISSLRDFLASKDDSYWTKILKTVVKTKKTRIEDPDFVFWCASNNILSNLGHYSIKKEQIMTIYKDKNSILKHMEIKKAKYTENCRIKAKKQKNSSKVESKKNTRKRTHTGYKYHMAY